MTSLSQQPTWRKSAASCLLLVTAAATLATAQQGGRAYLYTANVTVDQVGAFAIDLRSGNVTPIAGSPFPAGSVPHAVAATPNRRFLYAANTDSNTIEGSSVSGYRIAAATGALSSIAGSPFPSVGGGPHGIVVHPNGKFAYTANAGTNNVTAFSINTNNGALVPLPTPLYPVGGGPFNLTTDPQGRFLCVANSVTGNISAFAINPSTGILTEVTGSPFASVSNPSAVAVDPTGVFLYASGGSSNAVAGYTINQQTGSLTSTPGSPYTAGGGPRGVTIHPNGRFVYVPNADSSELSIFGINPGTGALTPAAPPIPVLESPAQAAFDPGGRFLYVLSAGPSQHGISAFSVDATTGLITPIPGSPFATDQIPLAVTIVP